MANEEYSAEDVRVTIETDDETIECAIVTIFEADGRDYIALLSCDEDGEPDPEGEIYFYRYSEDEEGNPEIENIEDDEEYEIATDVFDEWLDEQEIGDDD